MDFNKLSGICHSGDEAPVGADLSCAPPIYRPMGTPPHIPMNLLIFIIGPPTPIPIILFIFIISPFSSITSKKAEPLAYASGH